MAPIGFLDEDPGAVDETRRTYSVQVPWLSEDGHVVVAVVADRVFDIYDLKPRLDIAMRNAPPILHRNAELRLIEEEKQRYGYAKGILEDWAEITALASLAQSQGFRVSDEEIEEKLRELSSGPDVRNVAFGGANRAAITKLGISESDLREEVRNSMLIEKFVDAYVEANYDESALQRVYALSPRAFISPPRVHAFHVYRAMDRTMSDAQKKPILKQMKKYRSDLKKRKPDFAGMIAKSELEQNLRATDMGWVAADDPISIVMRDQLFGLKVGRTSDVFTDTSGVHVVRIIEREDGSDLTFEAVRPKVRNYVFAQCKNLLYAGIEQSVNIQIDPNGLKIRQRVTREEYERIRSDHLAPTASAAPVRLPDRAAVPLLPPARRPPVEPPVRLERSNETLGSRPAVNVGVIGGPKAAPTPSQSSEPAPRRTTPAIRARPALPPDSKL